MATRHQARQAVISLLYADELSGASEEFVSEYLEDRKIRNERKDEVLSNLAGVRQNMARIDELIVTHLKDDSIDGLVAVERAILRLGVFEMLYSDVDRAIIINEAIELAKELGSSGSARLVNAVLDSIKKALA